MSSLRRLRRRGWRKFFVDACRNKTEIVCSILIESLTPEQAERYDMYRRGKLRASTVRKVRPFPQ